MKILALHGYGTSSAILRGQLSPMMELLEDKNYELVFLQGRYPCERPPGLSAFVPGPFLSYTKDHTPSSIRAMHSTIADAIERQGPFDGVIGFSQGAAMALSYLLHHPHDRANSAAQPAPFKFAILFSCVTSFSPDDAYCASVLAELSAAITAAAAAKHAAATPHPPAAETRNHADDDDDIGEFSLSPDARTFCETLVRVVLEGARAATGATAASSPQQQQQRAAALSPGRHLCSAQGIRHLFGILKAAEAPSAGRQPVQPDADDGSDDLSWVPRVLHPALVPQRVGIPVVHVMGRRDAPAFVEGAGLMRELCDGACVRAVVHDGGHDLPRRRADVEAVVGAVEWAVGRGKEGKL